jgi:hypothetical protein
MKVLAFFGLFLIIVNCSTVDNYQPVCSFGFNIPHMLKLDTLSVYSLASQFPWDQWFINDYSPECVFKAFYRGIDSGILGNEDTVTLTACAFSRPHLSYGFFKRYHPDWLSQKNSYFMDSYAVFLHENWVGVVKLPQEQKWTPSAIMAYIPGGHRPLQLPGIFKSLPFKERIQFTETVLPRYFLGYDALGEVIFAKYHCFYDTAVVFRSFYNPNHATFWGFLSQLDNSVYQKSSSHVFWGKTQDLAPIYLLSQENGLIGIIGCNDTLKVLELSQKTQTLNLLIP